MWGWMHGCLVHRLAGALRLELTLGGGAMALVLPSPSVLAASPASLELEYQAEIEQITAKFAAQTAQERSLLDAELQARYDELEAKDRKLRKAEVKAASAAAERDKIRRQRSKIAKLRRVLSDELAARDRQLGAQIAAFREAVTKVAASSNPKKRAALKRYANGERKDALRELDEIVDAENDAIEIASKMKRAANLRPNALLGLNNKDHGEESLEQVIERFEKITGLDPGASWDWIRLAELYQEHGQLEKAAHAGELALGNQTNERERMVSLLLLGDIETEAGNLKSARSRCKNALAIAEKHAKADPYSDDAKRGLSVSLNSLGDLEVQAGNLAAARGHFQRSLDVSEELAKADPHSAQAKRSLSISLEKLGDLEVQAGNLAAARGHFQLSLDVREELAKEDPHSAQAKRDLSVSFLYLGDIGIPPN